MTKFCIDPPSGWQWGFPKIWDSNLQPNCQAWLIEQGYPQSQIDFLGRHFYIRTWEVEHEPRAGQDQEQSSQTQG